MEGVEEIPGTALADGLPWTWESFPEYLDRLDEKPRDIDIAALFPHGPLRVYVMGERGVNREPATEEDLAAMKQLVAQAMDAGAVGFSTSRTLLHLSSTGANVPTYQAATSELKILGEALSGERGHVMQFLSDWDDPEDEFTILSDTAAKTGAKGTFTLFYTESNLNKPDAPSPGGRGGLWKEQLKRLERAQANGLDIRGQVMTRPIGILMGHPASMSSFYRRPTMVELDDLPPGEKLQRLADPDIKARILAEKNSEDAHIFVRLLYKRYDMMYPVEDPIEYLPDRTNTVAAIAEREGRDPQEWLYDFFLGNDGKNLVYIPAINFSEEAIEELLSHPHTVTALGDGGAHVGSICDASANIYLLTKWVREKNLFDLAQGIRMLTREPATLYSLNDRGLLEVGMKADINIIDFEKLQLRTPHIVHDLPAGGKRFLQNADGILATFVSGQQTYRNGRATGALPGKLLRGKQIEPRNRQETRVSPQAL